jgi:glycosyltransferase involved in cell wall biosynthesis
MKKVILITNYWHFEVEKASSRYRTLAQMLSENGNKLEVVTSSFYHATKRHRDYNEAFLNSFDYKVTLLYEPGYRKNISLQRLKSHKIFAKSVMNYLKKSEKPDVIFLVVPSLDVADSVSAYARKNKIPLIVDIQDLWPEAFKMALNIPIISDMLFAPMLCKANRIYKRADRIVAVSDTYVQRGLKVNKNDNKGLYVYIGSDLNYVSEKLKLNHIEKPNSEFWITYIGALGHSYDIKLVIDSLKILNDEGISNIVFNVMGSGVLADEFKRYGKSKGINANFMGQTEYGKMMAVLKASDLAVNPIIGTSVSSIINKVADYAAVGIPVINTQHSVEYINLIKQYNAGINCESGNAREVAFAIRTLYENRDLRNEMKGNALKMGKDKFDRNITYKKIVGLIEKI